MGLLLDVTVSAHMCVCSGVGLPDHMLVCLAMAWPSLRSCGSDCGGVSWAMFVSPELCALSGACDPGCQRLLYCVYPLICVLGAVQNCVNWESVQLCDFVGPSCVCVSFRVPRDTHTHWEE